MNLVRAFSYVLLGMVVWGGESALGGDLSATCKRHLRSLTPWAVVEPRLQALLDSNEIQSFEQTWAYLIKSPGFRGYLRAFQVPLKKAPRSRRVALVNDYFEKEILPQYSGAHLGRLQDMSLQESLGTHGVNVEAPTGRQAIQELSARNRARIEAGAPPLDPEVQAQWGELVDSLRVFPVHNTHNIDSLSSDMPLMSSRDIRSMGFPGGANSQESFNRDFMQSDDQVFFHATLARTARKAVENRTMYGDHGLVLKDEAAREMSWVSPFIMYPNNLEAFGQVCCPKEAALIRDATWEQVQNGETEEIPVEQLMAVLAIKNRLGDFDFTHSDYEGMVRSLLLRSLSELKAKDLEAYGEATALLQSDNPIDLFALSTRLIYKRYGLPESFETKVPVAVPREALTPIPSRNAGD